MDQSIQEVQENFKKRKPNIIVKAFIDLVSDSSSPCTAISPSGAVSTSMSTMTPAFDDCDVQHNSDDEAGRKDSH